MLVLNTKDTDDQFPQFIATVVLDFSNETCTKWVEKDNKQKYLWRNGIIVWRNAVKHTEQRDRNEK